MSQSFIGLDDPVATHGCVWPPGANGRPAGRLAAGRGARMGSEKFGAPDIYTQSPRSTSPAKADPRPVRGDDEAHASIPQAEAPALFGTALERRRLALEHRAEELVAEAARSRDPAQRQHLEELAQAHLRAAGGWR